MGLDCVTTRLAKLKRPFHLVASNSQETALGLVIEGAVSDFQRSLFQYKVAGNGSWAASKEHVVRSIISRFSGFAKEYPQKNKMVSNGGHETISNLGHDHASIANRMSAYQTSMQHYSTGFHAAEFSDDEYCYPAFRGAKARSKDFTKQPIDADTLCEFWGTGSNGKSFGDSKDVYVGGGGMRVTATGAWTTSSMPTGLWFYGTEPNKKIPQVLYKMEHLALYPNDDNKRSLGKAANRYSVVYATTGTINTSDANAKTEVRELNEAEIKVAKKLKKLIRIFKFKDAVSDKGADARLHSGVIAQDVKSSV